MTRLATVLALSLALVTPAHAQFADIGSLTPTLTFPEPAPEPVTRADTGPDR